MAQVDKCHAHASCEHEAVSQLVHSPLEQRFSPKSAGFCRLSKKNPIKKRYTSIGCQKFELDNFS